MTTPIAAENVNAPARRPHGAAGWLGLAAAPTFAAMAWVSGGDAVTLCGPDSSMLPVNGMVSMYLLMGVFHLPPWLKLVSRRFHNPTKGD